MPPKIFRFSQPQSHAFKKGTQNRLAHGNRSAPNPANGPDTTCVRPSPPSVTVATAAMIKRQLGEPARPRHSPPTNDPPPREPTRTTTKGHASHDESRRARTESAAPHVGFPVQLLSRPGSPVIIFLPPYINRTWACFASHPHTPLPPSLSSSSSLFHCLS